MDAQSSSITNHESSDIFSGNLYIFYAFDVGDDIELEKIKKSADITVLPLSLPKYFKHYHVPLAVELPHPHQTSNCIMAKIHSFGVVSITYKIPFESTLDEVKESINTIYNRYQEQSISDAHSIYKKIINFTKQSRFFHLKTAYLVIQVDAKEKSINVSSMKKKYGGTIASMLRFETESLSEVKKNEILETSIGYYRGDMIVIDSEAAFVYDKEYQDTLDLFEFANIQQLELQYFDKILAQQLDFIYERKVKPLPFKAYLPFIGERLYNPVGDLGKLKVDISVITEQLEGSIKLAGETYFSELYALLNEEMGLVSWKESIANKLSIIKDIGTVYQNNIENIREDILSTLIILLIAIELIIGLTK
ncbi:MAG TPA: hypothetical protein VJ201_08595 [Candidatus Babeliales bacterium]|nr:hypothetical protein [Candidatus Babeliales bacterium]